MTEQKKLNEDKQTLLDYCNRLYERESTTAQQSGKTKWALYIAFTYVFSELLEHTKTLIENPDVLANSLLIFIYVLCFLPSLTLFNDDKARYKFDLRIDNSLAPSVVYRTTFFYSSYL